MQKVSSKKIQHQSKLSSKRCALVSMDRANKNIRQEVLQLFRLMTATKSKTAKTTKAHQKSLQKYLIKMLVS